MQPLDAVEEQVQGELEQVSATAGLATLPVAAWELSVGVWMTTKGFRTPVLAD